MSTLGLTWNEDITISSMCTVFAESEVVSLIAQDKTPSDIIHGLNESVASKTCGPGQARGRRGRIHDDRRRFQKPRRGGAPSSAAWA